MVTTYGQTYSRRLYIPYVTGSSPVTPASFFKFIFNTVNIVLCVFHDKYQLRKPSVYNAILF